MMDLRESLKKEVERSDELQKLYGLAVDREGIQAEISANHKRIAEATARWEQLQGDIAASEAGVRAAAEQYQQTVRDAAQKEQALSAHYAQLDYNLAQQYEARKAELEATLIVVEDKVRKHEAVVADYDEKVSLVKKLEADIAAKIAKLLA